MHCSVRQHDDVLLAKEAGRLGWCRDRNQAAEHGIDGGRVCD
jgi:hypothetical protein